MKYQFIICLLSLFLIGNRALSQQNKTASPKKSTTTVKSTAPKQTVPNTTIPTKPTTTTATKPSTTVISTSPPSKVEEKKPAKTTTTSTPSVITETPVEQPSSTTIQQSTGPIKGNKLEDVINEPKPKKIKTPKIPLAGRDIKFGIRAEVTQSFTLENGGGIDFSPGISIGLIVNLPINEAVSIQPEILYSMVSTKASTDDNNYVKSSLGSVLVPLMFNFNFGKSTTKFMLNLGGYGNYGLSQTTKVVSVGTTIKDGLINLGNDKFDFGGGIGVGVKLKNKLLIEARSFYSMKDNINKNGFGTIGVGYFF